MPRLLRVLTICIAGLACMSLLLADPPEVQDLVWCPGTTDCLQWVPSASTYRIYRGSRTTLPGLTNSAVDSCLQGETSGSFLGGISDTPAFGDFYWFLVAGVDATGEGSPGSGTAGLEIVNSLGVCNQTLCGNGAVNPPELCDDGNNVTETSCPYGTPVCTACSATCSQQMNLTGAYCGDAATNGPELCDDGNNVTETACPYGTPACTRCDAACAVPLNLTGAYCGDAATNGPEVCDDGNNVTETSCPYGTPTCTKCSATCVKPLNLVGPYCGDGATNGPELCDDGNNVTETSCPYGTPACSACSATCSQPLSLIGPYCGDGIINGGEACDDSNNVSGDGCSSTCQQECISPGTQTCGVGACARTVPLCSNGLPVTCVPGSSSPETCNYIDDNCDGTVDNGSFGDGFESNQSCGTARSLPTIGSDQTLTQTAITLYPSGDTDYFRINATETDSTCACCDFFCTQEDYRLRVTLTVPAGGGSYAYCIYPTACGSSPACQTVAAGNSWSFTVNLDGVCSGGTDTYAIYVSISPGATAPGYECHPYTLSYFFDALVCN